MNAKKIVLGTVQFGLDYGINNSSGKPAREDVFKILNFARASGIEELDTADAYGTSSEVLHEYFKLYPGSFKVMSKCILEEGTSFWEHFEKSCTRLGIESLEGYYFHRFFDFKNLKNFDDIHKLKKLNRLRNFAVSLYSNEELMEAINSSEVDVIQLPFNVFDSSSEKIELLKQAKRKGKKIYVRSVFLQGLFFKDVNSLPEKLTPLRSSLQKLHSLAEKSGIQLEELCLNFVVQQDFIDKVIIGVDSVEQLKRNVKSLEKTLKAEIVDEIFHFNITQTDLLNPVNWK